jgi:hypothetical protein
MPANTPIYNFPYPLGTDPVSQGDNDIRALAEDVEAVISTQSSSVGLVKVGSFSATNTSRALVCDNVFFSGSGYDIYKIVVELGSFANSNTLIAQYIDTNGNLVSAGYFSTSYGRDYASGTVGVTPIQTTTSIVIGRIYNSNILPFTALGAEFTLYSPNQNRATPANGQYTGVDSGVAYQGGEFYSMCNASPNTMRGIRFDNTQGTNLLGVVKIYGYKN